MNRVTKTVLLTLFVFAPYYFWVLRRVLTHTMPNYPWPAVIGLGYIIVGISFVIFAHDRMYQSELLASQTLSEGSYASFPNVVWVSSVEHLQRFRDLPWYAKKLGLIPEGFPVVTAGLIPFPLVYFAQAMLTLKNGYLECSTLVPEGKSYKNLRCDLQLYLAPEQVLSVSRFDMRQVAPTEVPLPFIRVKTISPGLPDFLVCAGSPDARSIGPETERLWHALASFIDRQNHSPKIAGS